MRNEWYIIHEKMGYYPFAPGSNPYSFDSFGRALEEIKILAENVPGVTGEIRATNVPPTPGVIWIR